MILSIINQKGGVGKTTTAINLAAIWANQGFKTLLVDLDQQGHATIGLGIRDIPDEVPTVFEILVKGKEPNPIEAAPNLHVWPGALDMDDLQATLGQDLDRYDRLTVTLQEKAAEYDHIILDCPPSLGIETINALGASTHYLAPVLAGYLSLDGLAKLLDTIKAVYSGLNYDKTIKGLVFLNQADPRTNLTKETIELLRETLGDKMLQSMIPQAVVIAEAPGEGLPVFELDPRSKAALAFNELSQEVLRHG